MQNIKTYGVGALVALVVALGVSYSVKSDNVDIDSIVDRAVTKIQETLGAVPGFDFLTEELNFNGVKYFPRRQPLATATSTICSIRSPRSATTTLDSLRIHVHNATATALVLEVGRSTTGYSTTTSLMGQIARVFSLGAQSHNTYNFIASTTVDSESYFQTNPVWEFAPGTYLNVRVGGAAGDADLVTNNAVTYRNYSPKGGCSAEFLGY